MFTLSNLSLLLAALLTALIAGLFYGYSCSVNPGLGRLDDQAYLSAMQQINRAILNPVFFLSFMGSLIVLPLCAWVCYSQGNLRAFYFVLSAALVYLVLVFGVTMAGNVPLNNKLDAFRIDATTNEQWQAFRQQFEMPWNRLHTVRTWASVLSFVLVLFAFIKK